MDIALSPYIGGGLIILITDVILPKVKEKEEDPIFEFLTYANKTVY